MRKLTKKEVNIISSILVSENSLKSYFEKNKHNLLVEEMNDEGMGSLKFVNTRKKSRKLGKTVGEKEFKDEDGTPVLICVNLDSEGDLFELDVWKVDFSPVKNLII